jgi:predicted TIM-barrel fold metal-dependent hydrolase
LYDSHLHFFTNDVAQYPIDPRNAREPEAVMRARIMADPGTPEKVFALWNEAGVTGGTGVQYNGAYKTDNSYLLDLADKFPDKIRSEIIVNAQDPASPDLVSKLAATRRISALRLVGFVDGTQVIPWLNAPAPLNLWAIAEKLSLPVGITFLPMKGVAASLVAVKALADRFSRCTILLEHFGRLIDSELTAEHLAFKSYENVHFKWTTNVIDELKANGRSTAGFLRRAVDAFGAERVMWGSDFGNTLRPYADMVADAIASTADLNDTERKRVLFESGAAMFGR